VCVPLKSQKNSKAMKYFAEVCIRATVCYYVYHDLVSRYFRFAAL